MEVAAKQGCSDGAALVGPCACLVAAKFASLESNRDRYVRGWFGSLLRGAPPQRPQPCSTLGRRFDASSTDASSTSCEIRLLGQSTHGRSDTTASGSLDVCLDGLLNLCIAVMPHRRAGRCLLTNAIRSQE